MGLFGEKEIYGCDLVGYFGDNVLDVGYHEAMRLFFWARSGWIFDWA